LITHIFTQELAQAIPRLLKPVVKVSGLLPDLKIPRVIADHEQVGRLAAEHFLDRGLRYFGFFGYTDHAFSKEREGGFRRVMEQAGFAVSSYLSDDSLHPEPTGLWRWNEGLRAWLVRLARPAGVLASHDIQGVRLSEVCHRAGLLVPDDVALFGVDDDDLLCKVARPPLSSMALPSEQIGFEASHMMEVCYRAGRATSGTGRSCYRHLA
jgi:LacI family transcriptional regulator